jgi:predicted component of type VI protein secretion system
MALDDAERESAERERQDALREIDEAPDSAVDYVLDRSLERARKRFGAADDKIESVKGAVQRAARNNANDDRRQDGEDKNRLRRAGERAKAAARGEGQGSND